MQTAPCCSRSAVQPACIPLRHTPSASRSGSSATAPSASCGPCRPHMGGLVHQRWRPASLPALHATDEKASEAVPPEESIPKLSTWQYGKTRSDPDLPRLYIALMFVPFLALMALPFFGGLFK